MALRLRPPASERLIAMLAVAVLRLVELTPTAPDALDPFRCRWVRGQTGHCLEATAIRQGREPSENESTYRGVH